MNNTNENKSKKIEFNKKTVKDLAVKTDIKGGLAPRGATSCCCCTCC